MLDILNVSQPEGGQSLGRWWWLEGSHGAVDHMYMSYKHPNRSPANIGVPKWHLHRSATPEDVLQWLKGQHPRYDLDAEWDLVWATVDCWGGPWRFEQSSILASQAIALACAAEAEAAVYGWYKSTSFTSTQVQILTQRRCVQRCRRHR